MAENFATKYRSKDVDKYIGNELAVQKLLNRFSSKDGEDYPACVMISGASGCGKTTMARMSTKLVLCENKQLRKWKNREYLLPCNQCKMCQDLNKYIETADATHLFSVKELDSSKTGNVDAVRQFVEAASMPRLFAGYSIFIFDECHLISKAGQESMLKFTEDAPPKSIFFFCTTDPQKIIETLQTRMDLKIEIELPSVADNVKLMTWVSTEEGFAFEKSALELIAVRSNCVFRQSLKQLENVYRSYGSVRYDDVVKVLDVNKNRGLYFDFLDYLRSKNIVLYTKTVHSAALEIGLKLFVDDLREFVKRGLYISLGLSVLGITKDEIKLYKDLFSKFTNDEILALLEFLNNLGRGDIETQLLLLGYRGLSTPKIDSEGVSTSLEVNPLKGNERLVESKQVAQKHIEDKRSHHEKTVAKAQLDLTPMSAEQMVNMFDNL